MTEAEYHVLEALIMRPNGAVFRIGPLKAAVLSLAQRQLVCDPHTMEQGEFFTRITAEGKLALAVNAEFDQADHPDAGGYGAAGPKR